MKKIILSLIIMSLVSCEHYENTTPCGVILTATYQKDIKPIIITKCATSSGCHGYNSPFGDFRNFNELKSTCNNGSFKERVIVKKDMPPNGSLDVCELEKIKFWFREGAKNN
jgi:hypothetical protein